MPEWKWVMSNGGDYWGSKITESIWLSWDHRRALPLPARHQADTHTHTCARAHTAMTHLQLVYSVPVCDTQYEGQTASPLLSAWWRSPTGTTDTHTLTHRPQVHLSHYQKVWQVEADKMDRERTDTMAEQVKKNSTVCMFVVCVSVYLYIFWWNRSHQNILLVETSTSRATAFFRVGTTWVYSLFSRSMRRISWRLVNIRYGLLPKQENIYLSQKRFF